MMNWSAAQYTIFEDERTRPVCDLVARIPGAPALVMDLGCGPGNSTEVLATRFPDAAISGLDSSQDMIDAARKRLPDKRFILGDIALWEEKGSFDVILSNAALQWVPDHTKLLPRLLGKLNAGGSLAIQMPDNLDQPSHRLMRETAASGPWAETLANAAGERTAVGSAEWYYALLRPHCSRVDIWRTTYHHLLSDGAAGIVSWFKATGLRPYLAPLGAKMQEEFLSQYQNAIASAYPVLDDGSVLLPFPRLFIIATR